jgi:peptidoglycan/LPS O-acetylase OafA/YrhL
MGEGSEQSRTVERSEQSGGVDGSEQSGSGRSGRTIAYQPALDGVRALAVAAVLLFHAEVPGFSGGYLGVSVFFTLSGYLITTLLLTEHATTGTISMPGFYARRVRRLLPASLVCLTAIVVISELTNVFAGVAELRRQVMGALLQVSNWVFLAGEGSYQQLFQQTGGARSPVEHFWSLSIEEQFYWLWPPTMAFLLGRCATRRSCTLALGSLTLCFALAAPLIAARFGPDAAYWATPARVGEILMGALVALLLHGRAVPRIAAWLAPLALVALAVCVATFPASSGPAYEGWLPAVAVGSALLVLGLQAESPVRRVLSTRPLVWLGGISYGVYLYHWPIYVIADERRTGMDGWQLVVVQLTLTLSIAEISYRLLERPIRRARGSSRRLTLAAGGLATSAVAVVTVAVVPAALGEYWQTDDATVAAAAIDVDGAPVEPLTPAIESTQPSSTSTTTLALAAVVTTTQPAGIEGPRTTTAATTTTTTTTTEPPLPTLSRPVRVVVAGDSTARATAAGLLAWAAEHPELAQVDVVSAPGCGFLRGGDRREGGWKKEPVECDHWIDHDLPARVAATQPDVVMMMVTTWDLVDHRWDDGDGLTPLDPVFEGNLAHSYAAVTDELLGLGAGSIAWIAPPIPNVWWSNENTGQADPARHAVLRSVIDGLAASHPGQVSVIDMRSWLDSAGLADDRDVRPDGVHLEPGAALRIAEDFLGERLVRVALG